VHHAPALVACSHGTRDPAGRRAISQLREDVSALRSELTVVEAYVDVQRPQLSDVLRDLGPAVVVPVLLSSGYHVHVDPVLVDVLAQRVGEAAVSPDHALVLAAAGSSDERAVADVERTATDLTERLGRAVVPTFAAAAEPRVDQAVTQLRSDGRRIAIASYLLAPGFFYDQLREAGADVVTAPLLPHPAIAQLVLRRYCDIAEPASKHDGTPLMAG
jgi:sirohydrochlorin ferrochelatase